MQLRSSTGQVYPLRPDNTTLGRSPYNDIVIPDPAVLDIHLDITIGQQGIYITPRRPGPGTLFNGQPLTQAVYLTPQDVIQIGPYRFQLVPAAAPAGPPPRYVAPPPTPGAPPPQFGPPPKAAPFGATVMGGIPPSRVKTVIAAAMALLAALMLLGFFAFSWFTWDREEAVRVAVDFLRNTGLYTGMSDSELASQVDAEMFSGLEGCSASAFEVATDDNLCTNVEGDIAAEKSSAMQAIELSLFLIPLGALALIGLSVALALGRTSPRVILPLMAVVAAFLLIFPFMWEMLYSSVVDDWVFATMQSMWDVNSLGPLIETERSALNSIVTVTTDIFKTLYSSGEQVILGGLMLLVVLAGMGITFLGAQSPAYQPPPGYFPGPR